MGNRFVVTTWNVNSIRARKEHLLAWLQANRPDIVCLQELKTTDDGFPFEELAAAGYHAATNAQKTYNGVAILSLKKPDHVVVGMDDADPQARLLTCSFGSLKVICAYFPNGSEPDSDKYAYKKDWIARFMKWLSNTHSKGEDIILCGDFNIAAAPDDVSDAATWEGTVIYNPEMRAAFQALTDWGLTDLFRAANPDLRAFSWWDYRMAGFRRNLGLRLDYVMATEGLAARLTGATIDRAERAREKPSDHAPVSVEFTLG